MKQFQNLLLEEFIQKNEHFDNVKINRINSSKEFILWLETKIEKLHDWLREYHFDQEQDEIYFFKLIKPCIISKLIYQKAVLRIELNAPKGKSQCNKYYKEELIKLSHYPQKDIKFYHYYRSGATENDKLYFTRSSKKNILETECFQINSDQRLSTCYDFKVAKIIASDELVQYLENQIAYLNATPVQLESNNKSKLYWSGSKIELVELIYALYYKKVINNGNTDIKEITTELSRIFNIELQENIYRYFTDIKNRKISKSKFMNLLSDNLNVKIMEEEF